MSAERWQIQKRRGGAFRRLAARGEQYDGSRWELHKSYSTEADARRALANLETKAKLPGGLESAGKYKIEQK